MRLIIASGIIAVLQTASKNLNVGTYSNVYISISFELGMMLGTIAFYILKLV